MSDDLYYSEREGGVPRPDRPEISPDLWAGFVALVKRLMGDGSLAERFPLQTCPDLPEAIISCDSAAVGDAFRGENPNVAWPLSSNNTPPTPQALDAIEFFLRQISEPQDRIRHDCFAHEHLTAFNSYVGQRKYRGEVNRLLRRNHHPYEISTDGRVTKMGPPVLKDVLSRSVFQTGDSKLDDLLHSAREKFTSPEATTRKEALEKLWDAWERLKSLEDADKKAGTGKLLAKAITERRLRGQIEKEARELTEIGNAFMIRHTECDTTPIEADDHIDYLFHRMFALIWLLLKSTARLR